jgi:hypothetical protein
MFRSVTTRETARMSESEFREMIAELLLDDDAGDQSVRSAESFTDAGVMTTNEGLVVTTADGAEFQLTIVRSR